ncbi:MAG: lipoyl synthase [Proteobacteria bacterium]|nr:lipoyl synthase [Pseudomonadota bacterium]
MDVSKDRTLRKPSWLKVKIPSGENVGKIRSHLRHNRLATVCDEARCPNKGDCWVSGTATFMLMGDTCTRSCRFCSVKTARHPPPLDREEPIKLAETVDSLELKYVVLTTVDRDDLPDQGAGHIRQCMEAIAKKTPNTLVELLIPDFQGRVESIEEVTKAHPRVIGHNLECTRNMTPKVRDPRANYEQSLAVLSTIKKIDPAIYTKSSLMVGFGESNNEVLESMKDLRSMDTDFLTIGQYLQPDKSKLPVAEYIHPDTFKRFEKEGLKMGFRYVASGPLVRSSYRAYDYFDRYRL